MADISDWHDKWGSINMLKVLYRDHVTTLNSLDQVSNTMEVFKLLIGPGHLNRTLLSETIQLTKQQGLSQKIKEQLPLPRDISHFSDYRQKLIKFGNKLTKRDRARISRMYEETTHKKYKDNWTLIMDLEEARIIKDDEAIMKEFTEMLKRNKINSASDALGVGMLLMIIVII